VARWALMHASRPAHVKLGAGYEARLDDLPESRLETGTMEV